MFLKTKQSILFIDAHLTIKELFTAKWKDTLDGFRLNFKKIIFHKYCKIKH
ncbi:hypothetical protein Avbf_11852, partial [Armadillidium vulgare]